MSSVLSAIQRFLLVPTRAIEPAHYRTYVTYNIGAIAAFFVHLGVLPLFWWMGAVELLWVNILSELAYLAALIANRRGHHTTMIAICAVELCVHQTLCVKYVGWGTGFQYYLLSLPAFIFFLPPGRIFTKLLLLGGSTAVFASLFGWSQHHPPVHAVASGAQAVISYLNISAVFGLLGFFGYNYRRAAEEAEARLAAHERKLADDRLLLLKAAVSAAQDVIVITDRDGHVEFVNEAFSTVTGFSSQEAIGRNLRMLKSGAHPQEFYADLWGTIWSGRAWSGRMVNRRKGGALYTESATITPIKDEHGAIRHFLAIKQDVTETERAGERLLNTEEQLRQAKKLEAIGTLAGGIAHDFNNLLTAILGNAECLQDALPVGHPGREDIEEIQKAGQRAATLTRQLLAYSRKQVLALQVLDLNPVVRRIEKLLRRSLSEQVEFVLRLSPSILRVEADEAQLGQVLLNLAVNANDAMPAGGIFVIETANASFVAPTRVGQVVIPSGDYVVISASDTGEGIAPDVLAQIFDPFFTTKGLGKGTGLGLSTVFGIVTQSGGYVAVQSELGVGTTFQVFFRSLVAPAAVAAVPAPVEHAPGTETVLLVEDDTAVRVVTSRMLRTSGYEVLEASDAQHALAFLDGYTGPLHLLLTDVMMPGINGPTLAAQVRSARAGVRVVFVSGYPGELIARHGTFVPGENFLSKPFSPTALSAIIRRALDA